MKAKGHMLLMKENNRKNTDSDIRYSETTVGGSEREYYYVNSHTHTLLQTVSICEHYSTCGGGPIYHLIGLTLKHLQCTFFKYRSSL